VVVLEPEMVVLLAQEVLVAVVLVELVALHQLLELLILAVVVVVVVYLERMDQMLVDQELLFFDIQTLLQQLQHLLDPQHLALMVSISIIDLQHLVLLHFKD
jgi:hypothetical protein